MPTYDCQCVKCGAVQEYHRPMQDSHNTPSCLNCSVKMVKVILSAPRGFVKGNFEPFRSTVDGSVLRTQRDVAEHNKRNNVVCLGDGYDDATVRSGNYGKKAEVKDVDKDIKDSIRMLEQGYKPTTHIEGAE